MNSLSTHAIRHLHALTLWRLLLPYERQSARMSKITNDGLTRSGMGCFIAVPIWQQLGRQRVKVLVPQSKHSVKCAYTMCFAMLLSVFWRYSSRWHRNCGLGLGVQSLHAVSRDGHHHGTKNLMPSHRFVYSGECYCEMFFLHTCSFFLIPADTRLSAWRFYMSPHPLAVTVA